MLTSRIDKITLRLSGMRGSVEYEIDSSNKEYELSYYRIVFENGEETRRLEKRVSLSAEDVDKALGEFGIEKWDGFHGAHPRGVRDGKQFTLEAFSDGQRLVYAEGSENFPRKFNDFQQWMNDILR